MEQLQTSKHLHRSMNVHGSGVSDLPSDDGGWKPDSGWRVGLLCWCAVDGCVSAADELFWACDDDDDDDDDCSVGLRLCPVLWPFCSDSGCSYHPTFNL